MMIPEAWEKHTMMDESRRAFYEYHAAMMEPWDGPAAIAFSDGRVIGATLDRNGLRPARYLVTDDDLVIMGSECGTLNIPEERIVKKWRLQPGRMFLADLEKGRIIDDKELKDSLAAQRPYREWIERITVKLDDLPPAAEALESATDYAQFADQLQGTIRAYRMQRMKGADEAVSSMLDGAQSLILWVSCSAFIAFVLIGPLGLTITRRVLVRLDRITQYMTRLAGHDVSADVPSRDDGDEVGDIARAVQVFKEDAVELLQRKAELEQVNLRLDVALNNMTHGLCMFDAGRKLIICNARYAAMYALPEHLWKPGTALEEILRFKEIQFAPELADAFAEMVRHLPPMDDTTLKSMAL